METDNIDVEEYFADVNANIDAGEITNGRGAITNVNVCISALLTVEKAGCTDIASDVTNSRGVLTDFGTVGYINLKWMN